MNKEILKEALKTDNKKEALKQLDPLIGYLKEMLQGGTTIKNARRHLMNRGIGEDAATNLIDIAELRASKMTYYKLR